MIVNFAGQTLFIWKITVTSKFDSIFNHPESDHQVSNMPVWVICKVHNLLYLVHLYCGIGMSVLKQKPYVDYTSFSVTMLEWIRLEVGK